MLRFFRFFTPRAAMLFAIWCAETAMKIAPDTENGRLLRGTLANFFLRREAIERSLYDANEETHKLTLEAREHQQTLGLVRRKER